MRRSSFALITLLGLFSVTGFGCRVRPLASLYSPVTFPAKETPVVRPPPYVSKKTSEDTASKEVVELRQILNNLAKTLSYHSRIIAPTSDGIATADLYYSKKNGIHGILRSVGGDSQLFVHDRNVFVRYATSSWQDVSVNEEGETARTQLQQSLFVNDDGTSRFLLRDSAKILSTKDDPSGCKLYVIEQKFFSPSEYVQKIEICTQNSFPARIKSSSIDGSIEISYDRFNDDTILAVPPNTQN